MNSIWLMMVIGVLLCIPLIAMLSDITKAEQQLADANKRLHDFYYKYFNE